MYPIVNITYSAPTMNTHSRRCTPILDPDKIDNGYGAFNIQFFFALPNIMDKNNIVQLIQCDTTIYDLEDLGPEAIMEWKGIKKNKARKRWMRQIRK